MKTRPAIAALLARARAVHARIAPWIPLLRILGFVGAAGIVVAMAVSAVRDDRVRQLDWVPLLATVGAAAVWWLLLARGWGLVLDGRATRGNVATWCRTQALRYVPGGFWAPASRAAIMHGHALDRIVTVAAENVCALCAALGLGGLALAIGGEPLWGALVLVLVAPVLAARYSEGRSRIDRPRAVRATVNYTLAFLAYMAAAILAQDAAAGLHDAALVAGAAAVAWGAGLVVVIAPSGVGVRELVYVGLLHGHYTHGQLVAGALALRVATVAAELCVLLLAGRPQRAEVPAVTAPAPAPSPD
jgi:glycosyltransferase 2 family protein